MLYRKIINKRKTETSILLFLFIFLWVNIVQADSEATHQILLKGIEANFSGDYDRAEKIFSTIRQVDPNHPSRLFYQAVVLFWRDSVDAGNPRHVDQIRKYLTQAIKQAEEMLLEDENSIDAMHYLGLVYTYLGRLEAHNGNYYKGGVLGEKGRKFLERAITFCEQKAIKSERVDKIDCRTCEDLYFPYGAYSYFAGRLPQFLKYVDFLWFIPSGSTEEGMNAIERAFASSSLHKLGAKSLLIGIILNFETDRLDDALKLSDELVSRFPDNPFLELQHAGILMATGSNHKADDRADKIIDKVGSGKRNYDDMVKQGALLVKAEVAIREVRVNFAEKILSQLQNNSAYQNNSLTPKTFLLLGMKADLEKQRGKAIRYYEQVKTFKGSLLNRSVRRKAKEYLKSPFVNLQSNKT